jgi:hypothetical protein
MGGLVKIGLAILYLLIGVCVIVGVGWVVVFVCSQLGIMLPEIAVRIAEIILGLLVLIYIIRIVASGGDDPVWPWSGPKG